MFSLFSVMTILILLESSPVCTKKFIPNFHPFCSTAFSCRKACSCSSPACTLLPMNDRTREEILYHHNKIRNKQTKKSPQPSGLSILEYDLDLEDVSSCWASECSEVVTNCFRTPNYLEISQTVGKLSLEEEDSPKVDYWMSVFDSWLVNSIHSPLQVLYTGDQNLSVHNMAQILSDKILFVGCSWALSKGWIYFVCSYGPKGPSLGQDVYTVGEICSTCPKGYECQDVEPFNRLCKPRSYREIERRRTPLELDEVNVDDGRSRHKYSRGSSGNESNATPKKKKKDIHISFALGVGVFVTLILFFTVFSIYAYIGARVTPNDE